MKYYFYGYTRAYKRLQKPDPFLTSLVINNLININNIINVYYYWVFVKEGDCFYFFLYKKY